MGYAAEKEKVEKKIGYWKRILLFAVAIVILSFCLISAYYPPETWKYYFSLPKTGERADGEMRIHFIDVGQGDATLIELPDGKIMLIDGGDGKEEATLSLMRYLNALRIEEIDYLVVSHPDADHCGGLVEILETKKVKRAFLPKCEATASTAYAAFYSALMKTNCEWEYSMRSVGLDGEGEYPYTLRFLYPYTWDIESGETATDDNENSSVIWLDYQGVSALFTGDAPKSTEKLLVRDDKLELLPAGVDLTSTEILKVSHHGSASATDAEFVEYLGIKQAVVFCGKDNEYGHPTAETYTNLTAAGAQVYRTDLHGSVIARALQNGECEWTTLGK